MIHPLAEKVGKAFEGHFFKSQVKLIDQEIRKWLEEKAEKISNNFGYYSALKSVHELLELEPEKKWCELCEKGFTSRARDPFLDFDYHYINNTMIPCETKRS